MNTSPANQSGMESFRNSEYADSTLKGFHKAWKEGDYCDITLRTGEKAIRAHRLVLSSLSDYFKTLISMDLEKRHMVESERHGNTGNEVELFGVDYPSLCSILEYAYTGNIDISQENVQMLVVTADYLQVNFVKHSCEEFFLKYLNIDNLIEFLIFAKQMSLDKLYSKGSLLLGQHFLAVTNTDIFLEIPCDVLQFFANNDDLVLFQDGIPLLPNEREHLLLQAILKYIQSNPDRQENSKLLEAVRLPFIDKKVLEQELALYPKLTTREDFCKIFDLAKHAIQKKKMKSSETYPQKWFQDRCHYSNQTITFYDDRTFAAGLQTGQPSKRFHDGKNVNINLRLTGMAIFIRLWDGRRVVGGIESRYSDGSAVKHGLPRNEAVSVQEFNLGRDEIITEVVLNAGWMIDQLTFLTNKGKAYGPFGGDGGGRHVVQPQWTNEKMYFLHGFVGGEVKTQGKLGIVCLRFAWRCINNENSSGTGNSSNPVVRLTKSVKSKFNKK